MTQLTDGPVRPDQPFVLYWMSAHRRLACNFALERAVNWSRELGKPLLIADLLFCGGRWDTLRIHAFELQAMSERSAALQGKPLVHYPFVEEAPGRGRLLLHRLLQVAAVAVSDDLPLRENRAAALALAEGSPVRFEAVDSNGLLPLAAAPKTFLTAASFRRFLQQELPGHLSSLPEPDPLIDLPKLNVPYLPEDLLREFPLSDPQRFLDGTRSLAALQVDQSVPPAPVRGGESAALAALGQFLDERLTHYPELRNHPDADATSRLSPYLRAGHISVHQCLAELARREGWHLSDVAHGATGSKEGWWGMSPAAEAWLDELVTWREIGFNMCLRTIDYDRYQSLPAWARATLDLHASDPREQLYTPEDLEQAATHDDVWNAAQTQLVCEGRMHNYLRMLWGKKLLEWTPSPREALDVMVHLNNKYALDGCDPNSYAGIFWCLGRYDRPWAPERSVFGVVRYMSSANTRRKLKLKDYLARYG